MLNTATCETTARNTALQRDYFDPDGYFLVNTKVACHFVEPKADVYCENVCIFNIKREVKSFTALLLQLQRPYIIY